MIGIRMGSWTAQYQVYVCGLTIALFGRPNNTAANCGLKM
jgi:hypothetical protein